MKLDVNHSARGYHSKGEWELSIRSNRYSPFGIFITTPRRRLWAFLRRLT